MSRAATMAPRQKSQLLSYRARAQAYQFAYLIAVDSGAIEDDCERIRLQMAFAFAVFREYREFLEESGVRL